MAKLPTAIVLTDCLGRETTYENIAVASEETGLTIALLKRRATSESTIKGTSYRWACKATRKHYLGKRARNEGNGWERNICQQLRERGYPGCVTSRSESRNMDSAKVDIIDTKGDLPCYIQAKHTKITPNYFKLAGECEYTDKPFVVIHKGPRGPATAIIPLDFFYKLIKKR